MRLRILGVWGILGVAASPITGVAAFSYFNDFSALPSGITQNNPHGHYVVTGGQLDFTAQGSGNRLLSTHMNHAANLEQSVSLGAGDTKVMVSFDLTVSNEQSELSFPGVGIYANNSLSDFVRIGGITSPASGNFFRMVGYDGGTGFVDDDLSFVAGSSHNVTMEIDLLTGAVMGAIDGGGSLTGMIAGIVGASNFTFTIGVDSASPIATGHDDVLLANAFDVAPFDYDGGATTYSGASGSSSIDNVSVSVIPEPGSIVMLMVAAGALGMRRRR